MKGWFGHALIQAASSSLSFLEPGSTFGLGPNAGAGQPPQLRRQSPPRTAGTNPDGLGWSPVNWCLRSKKEERKKVWFTAVDHVNGTLGEVNADGWGSPGAVAPGRNWRTPGSVAAVLLRWVAANPPPLSPFQYPSVCCLQL
jgi:hypothetical protein